MQDSYFTAWHETQKKHLQFIHEAFSPLPIREVPLFPQEAVGFEMLQQTGAALFGEEDPLTLYYDGQSLLSSGKTGAMSWILSCLSVRRVTSTW